MKQTRSVADDHLNDRLRVKSAHRPVHRCRGVNIRTCSALSLDNKRLKCRSHRRSLLFT